MIKQEIELSMKSREDDAHKYDAESSVGDSQTSPAIKIMIHNTLSGDFHSALQEFYRLNFEKWNEIVGDTWFHKYEEHEKKMKEDSKYRQIFKEKTKRIERKEDTIAYKDFIFNNYFKASANLLKQFSELESSNFTNEQIIYFINLVGNQNLLLIENEYKNIINDENSYADGYTVPPENSEKLDDIIVLSRKNIVNDSEVPAQKETGKPKEDFNSSMDELFLKDGTGKFFKVNEAKFKEGFLDQKIKSISSGIQLLMGLYDGKIDAELFDHFINFIETDDMKLFTEFQFTLGKKGGEDQTNIYKGFYSGNTSFLVKQDAKNYEQISKINIEGKYTVRDALYLMMFSLDHYQQKYAIDGGMCCITYSYFLERALTGKNRLLWKIAMFQLVGQVRIGKGPTLKTSLEGLLHEYKDFLKNSEDVINKMETDFKEINQKFTVYLEKKSSSETHHFAKEQDEKELIPENRKKKGV